MLNVAAAVSALLLIVSLTVAPAAVQEVGDLVSLDVTVVDNKGHSVTGLKASDFRIKDDGAAVDVTTFVEVSPDDPDVSRSIVILLDDVAIPIEGTETMRT